MNISAGNISAFFSGTCRKAQGLLPELLRRLIFAHNINQIQAARFPTGDNIQERGFDGYVVLSGSTPWIPDGKSVWEVGCSADPQTKADEDWRAADLRKWPNIKQRSQEYTWVFVTPHKWPAEKRNHWINEKNNEGKWKDVKAFDCTDLEAWLDQCPAVSQWLATAMCHTTSGMFILENWLSLFLAKYKNSTAKANLIIGGRKENSEDFEKWFSSESPIIDIRGESRQEAAWFTAAVAFSLPLHKRNSLISRLIYVETPEAVDIAVNNVTGIILVPLSEEAEAKALTLTNRGCRVICLGVKRAIQLISQQRSVLELHKIRATATQIALSDLNVPERLARIIAKESKGSLHAVLWALNENSAIGSPPWQNTKEITIYASLWLAGQWIERNDKDKTLIEQIAEKSWSDIEPVISSELAINGQFEKFGSMTDWKAWPTCINFVIPAFSIALLKRYKKAVIDVFSMTDPRVEMSSEEKLFADLSNINHPYSKVLRAGLLSSLAMIGTKVLDQRVFVDQIVCELLSGRGKNLGLKWATMASELGDLAEAAPESFIKACRELSMDIDACKCLFIEDGIAIFSSRNFHCNILWALERLAWHPDYFSDVVDILAALEGLGLKTSISNTPLGSLVKIFLPWLTSTLADYSLRTSTFNALANRYPNVAWTLACKLMPSPHSVSSNTQKPQWHNWLEEGIPKRPANEYYVFTSFLLEWIIKEAAKKPEYYYELIDKYQTWHNACPPSVSEKFVRQLSLVEVSGLDIQVKKGIYEKLLALVSSNIEYGDSEWAIKDQELKPFKELINKFASGDLIIENLWLFDPWPKFIQKKLTYEDREQYIADERLNAINKLHQYLGVDNIFKIVESESRKAYCLGNSMARLNLSDDDEDKIICYGLKTPIEKTNIEQARFNFSEGYIREKLYVCDTNNTWLNYVLSRSLDWNPVMYANLALMLPPTKESWDRIAEWGNEVKNTYWKNVYYHVLRNPERDLALSVKELLAASRPCMAIDTIAMTLHSKQGLNIDETLIEQAITNAAEQESDISMTDTQMLPYNIDKLLEYLESIGKNDDDLMRLEWIWMSALERSERGIKSLRKCLATNPSLFVSIINLVFKGENEEREELSEEDQQRASMGYRLLSSWHHCPATEYTDNINNPDIKINDNVDRIPFRTGIVNEEALCSYFMNVRKLLANAGRLKIGDSQLGGILAYSPLGDDGNWPCEKVCRLIESISSDSLERGLIIGIHNKRGCHFVAPGGKGELAITEQFKKYLDSRHQYPRTRKILAILVRDYKEEAKSNQDHERFEEFWN